MVNAAGVDPSAPVFGKTAVVETRTLAPSLRSGPDLRFVASTRSLRSLARKGRQNLSLCANPEVVSAHERTKRDSTKDNPLGSWALSRRSSCFPALLDPPLRPVACIRTLRCVENDKMGPVPSLPCSTRSGTATVSVGRCPHGASFGEPVKEFDPRPVRHNIGDAQPLFALR